MTDDDWAAMMRDNNVLEEPQAPAPPARELAAAAHSRPGARRQALRRSR